MLHFYQIYLLHTTIPEISIFYLVFSRIMIMWELVSESLDREIQMLGGEGPWRPGERGWRQWWQLVDQGQPQHIQAYRTIVDLKSKFSPFLKRSWPLVVSKNSLLCTKIRFWQKRALSSEVKYHVVCWLFLEFFEAINLHMGPSINDVI